MTRKSAAVVAACVAALVGGGVYASPQYTAWRARLAASSGIDHADGAESEAKAKAEPAFRAAAIAWGQVHLGVNAFIYGTFSVSACPVRFACGSLALRPSRQ